MKDVHIKTIIPSRERMIRCLFAVAVGVVVIFGVPLCSVASASELTDLFREAAPGSAKTVDHSEWDRLLKAYVKPGADGLNRVDYAAFKRALDRREQFVFLVNLYDAKTIDVVLDNYPIKSIKDISLGGGLVALVTGGPWKAKILKVKGVDLSLDDIEQGILRPLFKDPRARPLRGQLRVDRLSEFADRGFHRRQTRRPAGRGGQGLHQSLQRGDCGTKWRRRVVNL